ncbi:MAG: phytanoyl-CoA dioxygenase family protein [Ilumatobacteraceae bacterium]
MNYRTATDDDVEFFREHGWIVVDDVIDPEDLTDLQARCDEIVTRRDELAFDWAWERGEDRAARQFRILQAMPNRNGELDDARFRRWALDFASALLGSRVESWYDQFLAKPKDTSVPTRWHQDEAYWGRNLDGRGITCWMPFHDVDVDSGCMHFIDGGHRDGILLHERPANIQSDLLECHPDERRTVACPVRLGGVTFHHGKTPHMTTANTVVPWRRVLTQHFRQVGTEGEGDHYPWRVWVNQFTGEVFEPDARSDGGEPEDPTGM